ncbi:Xylitol dehydrogenase A [Hyphodiscus hymeniophilus]|uniref:D-xylulose reductase n=1 Tax=Hyphodiscus hymeniophilus TaxID=353542 RepID=A0A9P6VSV8_9HELO|nr:Xylitol dehydrogenase A [Hyphodiscus hymeniophilus]
MDTVPHNPACYLYGPGDAKFEDSPYPAIDDPYDVIIRIAYVGVCGSDVHFWTHGGIGSKITPNNPLIMGHEAAGTVHSIGSSVTTLQPGDRVAIEPGYPCRRCNRCKSGRYNLCPSMTFAASPPNSHGTLRKYYKIPADFCYKLPAKTGLDEGVLVEPLAVAVHVTRQADIRVGMKVVVFGAGTVGLLCAAVARIMGAGKIICVDVNASRLELAGRYAGAGTLLPSRSDSAEETAQGIISGHGLPFEGADVVLEATGAEPCIETGIHVLRSGGTFVQAGLGKAKIRFPIVTLSEKELDVKGSFRDREDWGEGVDYRSRTVRESNESVGEHEEG